MNKKTVLVFGSGISGISASRLLEDTGHNVILYDGNGSLDREKIQEELGKQSSAEILLGEFPDGLEQKLDMCVLSPGVPTDLPMVEKMRRAGVMISGEIELAFSFGKGDVLAITGTNGKTTTTTLLGEIMKAYKDQVYVVGNIGNPYTAEAKNMTDDSVVVAEISSFQLETIHDFCPKVSAILNITPDHLNRHHTMEAYIKAKKDIAVNQDKKDICVLNYEDVITRKIGEEINADVFYFSSQQTLKRGIYLENGNMIYHMDHPIHVCHVSELKLLGTHNYENVMAAVAMAAAYGVPMDVIRKVVLGFAGVEHRIEYVCEKAGVAYYNDSKGTNPDAAIKGIQAMNRPTVLIGGGYDKDSNFEEWIQSFNGKVKLLVLLGATKEKIAKAALSCGFDKIAMAEDFEEAVAMSVQAAKPGDAVLLSPACASWGMFKNYEERGDKFKEIVKAL